MTKSIKIAHIFPILSLGGLWRHLLAAEQLNPAKFSSVAIEIFQLETSMPRALVNSSIHALGAPPREYRNLQHLSGKVMERLRELRPDVVHTYHCFADFYAISAAAELGIPVVRTVAGISQMGWGDSFEARTARENWNQEEIDIDLGLEKAVSVTLSVSEDMKKRLCGYGIPSDKIRVSHVGTNTYPPPRDPPYVRVRSCGGSVVIGFMHRLEPVKLVPVLLLALRNLVSSGVRVKMVLVEGGRLTGSFVSELDDAGVRYDLLPPTSNLWDLVPPLDCLLLASQSEGLPLLPLEAMARGVPVISTPVGGVREIIEHGVTGWLYERHDAEGLERALRTAAGNPQAFASISAAALKAVRTRMDTSNHVRDIGQTYMSLVGLG